MPATDPAVRRFRRLQERCPAAAAAGFTSLLAFNRWWRRLAVEAGSYDGFYSSKCCTAFQHSIPGESSCLLSSFTAKQMSGRVTIVRYSNDPPGAEWRSPVAPYAPQLG